MEMRLAEEKSRADAHKPRKKGLGQSHISASGPAGTAQLTLVYKHEA
jgi:hypothetical protein